MRCFEWEVMSLFFVQLKVGGEKSKALFMVDVGALEVEGLEDVFRKALG